MTAEEDSQKVANLRDQEESFSKLTEIYKDCIILHDLNGDIVDANDNVIKELGYEEWELGRLNIRDLQPRTKRECDDSPIALDVYNDSKVEISRTVFVRKNGSRFPADVKTSYMRFKQGDENITVVQRVFRHLETSEKVAEYSRSRRSSSEKSDDNEKTDFFDLLNQELKSPLDELLGAIKLLSDTKVDAQQNQLLAISQKSGAYLVNTINDILDFLRLNADQLPVEKQTFNLVKVIGDVVDMMTPVAEDKGLDFSSYIDAAIPEKIEGDGERVKQVILKLLSNAITLTEEGSVKIEVNATVDGRVRFEVIDSGGGIGESDQQELFSDEFTDNFSVSKHCADVALGYSLAKKLVDKMGGNIGFSSMSNEGTLFWFSLDASPEGKEITLEPKYNFLKNENLIFIDFKDSSRNQLERQVASWGANLTSLSDEHEAIESFTSREIDSIAPSLIVFNVHKSNAGHAALIREINAFLQRDQNMISCNFVVITPSSFSPETAKNFARVKHTHVPHPLRIGDFANKLARLLCLKEPFEVSHPDHSRGTVSPKANSVEGAVLVVDSREVTCLATASILSKDGFKVDCAASGEEAIEMCKASLYDAVLLDLDNVEGAEIAQQIRENEAGEHHTPILAVTKDMQEHVWRNCINAGLDDYITKPIDEEVVIKTIEYWMGTNEVSDPFNIGKNAGRDNRRGSESGSHETPDHDVLLRYKSGSPVNGDTIRQLVEDTSSEITAEMLDLFLTETEERIERLKNFSSSHEFVMVADEAHTLVCSSGTFGATWLERLASSLEEQAKRSSNDECDDLIKDLPALYRESRKALLQFRQSNWT